MQENEMLSRALSLATVILLAGFATVPARAQNLEAGKSASQIFAGGCAVCHKSPRGLLKTVAPGSLPGFLRQHYTTSTDMAASMSAYVISNGAADRRPAGDTLTRQGRELTTEQKPAVAPTDEPAPRRRRRGAVERAQEADQPLQAEPTTRPGRNRRRAIPAETPVEARPGSAAPTAESPSPLVEEQRPAGRKQRLGKKGRRLQQEPKPDGAREPSKPAPATESVTPRQETPPAARPADEAPKPDVRPEAAPARADPVPPVTPAPKEPEQRVAPADAAPTPAAPATTPAPVAPAPTPSAPSTVPAPEAAPTTPTAPAAPQ
jgi:hypothetical protein